MEKYQFLKCHRLLKPKQFKLVFNDSRKIKNHYLLLFIKKNEINHPRLGLAISKKSVKRAVDRNRIKRIIRNEFRHQKESLNGIDMVVVSKPDINCLSNQALRELLERQWKKIESY